MAEKPFEGSVAMQYGDADASKFPNTQDCLLTLPTTVSSLSLHYCPNNIPWHCLLTLPTITCLCCVQKHENEKGFGNFYFFISLSFSPLQGWISYILKGNSIQQTLPFVAIHLDLSYSAMSCLFSRGDPASNVIPIFLRTTGSWTNLNTPNNKPPLSRPYPLHVI